MTTATKSEGNPDQASFDPSTASADELREMLSSPTGLDKQFSEGNPDTPDPVSEFAEPELAEPQPETEEPLTEEEPNASTEENAETTPEERESAVEDTDPSSEASDENQELLKKQRLRPRNALDQQAFDLYRSEGFDGTLQEAVDIVYRRQQQTPEPQEEQRDDPVPESTVTKELETVQENIKSKEKELSDAMEEFDQAKVATIQRELTKLEIQQARLEDRRDREQEAVAQTQEQTRRQQAAESRGRAVEKYPVLNNPDSIERKQFDAFLQQQANNPAIAPIFQSPLWPEVMADRFAAQTGLAPTSGKPSPESTVAPTKKAPVTGTKAKQLTTGRAEQPEQTVTKEGLRRDMGNMSREQLEALLGKKAS